MDGGVCFELFVVLTLLIGCWIVQEAAMDKDELVLALSETTDGWVKVRTLRNNKEGCVQLSRNYLYKSNHASFCLFLRLVRFVSRRVLVLKGSRMKVVLSNSPHFNLKNPKATCRLLISLRPSVCFFFVLCTWFIM